MSSTTRERPSIGSRFDPPSSWKPCRRSNRDQTVSWAIHESGRRAPYVENDGVQLRGQEVQDPLHGTRVLIKRTHKQTSTMRRRGRKRCDQGD